jgi:RHS repeat-associated protein
MIRPESGNSRFQASQIPNSFFLLFFICGFRHWTVSKLYDSSPIERPSGERCCARISRRLLLTVFTLSSRGSVRAGCAPRRERGWRAAQPATGSFPIGHLTTIADGSGTTQRTYDAKGRASSETRTIGSAPALTTSYLRDLSGNITDAFYPSGDHFVWNRDGQGRVQELAYFPNGSTTWTDLINPVAWNPYGPVSTLAFANGLAATFGLDTDYRINAVNVAPVSGPAILNRALSWTGDIVDLITDNVTSGNSETLGYSPTRRLSSAIGAYGGYAWTYDPVGNRASETLAGTATAYTYPSTSNQLASLTQGATTLRSFSYDADGDVATDTKAGVVWTYAYDSEGRLAQATSGVLTVGTYTYDGLWRLARRVTTAGETHYLQDLDGHIIAETDASGNTLREYVWLGDMPVAVIDAVNTPSPVTYYVHTDHLMRPAMMTDVSGNVVWSALYKPFGEVLSITGLPVMNARFPGQWFQLETGLHYNWHRHYDPTIGRYVQPDLAGFVDGPSVYAYAGNTPLTRVDPRGTQEDIIFPLPRAVVPRLWSQSLITHLDLIDTRTRSIIFRDLMIDRYWKMAV